ncbi:hypothetical protein CEE37_14185 [candidate division LCP-89 bacterium B3_LCP]|uniref:CDP-alcohol phosphatidyltransferase n=1 Tax=candidate division LCP-89 bacterium B3_LCP TaxID=2012998 RepID=A0A532UQP1_UNCL8|nr:MAG: hypothetical protein CEE37_14185 [candidate division LCP-89 bacterium B3_LCP]
MAHKMSLREKVNSIQKRCWDIDAQPVAESLNLSNLERSYISRKLSIWITYFFLKIKSVTPNFVTNLWVILGIAGAVLLAFGEYWLSIMAVVLIYFSWLLDNVDGEISRYRNIVSVEGNFTDMVGHHIIFPLVFGALTLANIREGQDIFYIISGILATALVTPLTKMEENINILALLEYLAKYSDNPFKNKASELEVHDTDDRNSGSMKSVKSIISFAFTQCCMLYVLVATVILGLESYYLLFYGIGITLIFIPKFITRRKALGRIVRDPDLLKNQFRSDWIKASTDEDS